VELVNTVLRAQFPLATRPFFAGAVLWPFVKPDRSGIRPIACGGVIRRLVSKVAVGAVVPSLTAYLRPFQVGLGAAGGVEDMVHAVNRVVHAHGQEESQLLALLDLKNALNSVSRGRRHGLLAYFYVCYGGLPTPPSLVGRGMEAIDAALHVALRHIVVGDGGSFDPLQDELAALPLCMGGLGVYRGQAGRPHPFLVSALHFRRLQDEILGKVGDATSPRGPGWPGIAYCPCGCI
jgi:hypothetical protein